MKLRDILENLKTLKKSFDNADKNGFCTDRKNEGKTAIEIARKISELISCLDDHLQKHSL